MGLKSNMALVLGGTLSGFSSSSFRLTNGSYNGSAFSPKLYTSGWAGGSVARISTYKIAKIGQIVGLATFAVSSTLDGIGLYNYYNNPTSSNIVSPEKAAFNTMLGYASYSNPYFGIPYGLSELFIPGGFNTVIGSGIEIHKFQNSMSRQYKWYPNYSTITQY